MTYGKVDFYTLVFRVRSIAMNVNPTTPKLYILRFEVQNVDYIGKLLRQRLNIIGKRVIKIFSSKSMLLKLLAFLNK